MRVLLPTNEIVAKLGIDKNGAVQKYFTHLCADEMRPYLPYDSGTLSDTYYEGTNYVEYIQPYAEYVYLGISKNGNELHYQTDHNPLATSYWDVHMWTAKKDKIVDELQKYMEGRK